MSRTYQQIRRLTAQQTGLLWLTGTADASGSTTSILQADALTEHGDDRLNGFHILLTSGSPSYTELHIKDFYQTDGQARFEPELSAAPDSLTFEILPFSGTDFLRAITDAIYTCYDEGWLRRQVWMRLVGGSPLYNADFSYWTSSSAVDGWTATTTTPSQERASANLALSETSCALTTAAGYVSLDAKWRRYLQDLKGSSVTFFCLVKTSTASNARLNLVVNGTDNYSSYHGGGGEWELLHVTVDTAETDSDIEPRLYIDTTSTAYFNLPFLDGGVTPGRSPLVREYPFPVVTMPDGPDFVQLARLDVEKDQIASGRGTCNVRQLPRQRSFLESRLVKHHDENTTTEVGILDFSQSRFPPRDWDLLWLRGGGPLTVPTSALSTDNIEVTETESLLLAKLAAVNLLSRGPSGTSFVNAYIPRINQLQADIARLTDGAGQHRDVASYGLGW